MKPARKPDPSSSGGAFSPEAVAKLAVARKPTTASRSPGQVRATLFLPRDVAEYVIARAIREGKNTAGLVAELPVAESRRRW